MSSREADSSLPEIRLIQERDILSFHAALCSVVLEQKYLAFTEPPAFENTIKFVGQNIADGIPQYVAISDDEVVGWCDIALSSIPAYAHTGRVGMGIIASERGKGTGRRLLSAVIEHARRNGLKRIELDVYTSNTRAIRLYESLGFQIEGTKRKHAQIAGAFNDSHVMGLLIE